MADNENQSGSLEDFMFRRYSPVQGRWISPDPAGLAAVDPTNPQTWNRYAYVMNNPLAYVDPLGLDENNCILNGIASHCSWVPSGGGGGGGGGGGIPVFGTASCYSASAENGDGGYVPCTVLIGYTPSFGGGGGVGGGAANNGTQQQQQNQQPSRLKDCAKAYYGFNTLPGAAQDATRLALIPAAPIIPKAAVGLPQALGSGPLTNLFSYFSLGSGTAASGANIFRVAGRIGAPIAIASAVIDATAIGICASDYQGWLPHF